MEPVIDHIQVTVRDVRAAEAFYDQLMPLLGFVPMRKGKATIAAHDFEVVEYQHPRLAFAITSPRAAFAHEPVHRRRPGALHHLAFKAAEARYAKVGDVDVAALRRWLAESRTVQWDYQHIAKRKGKLVRLRIAAVG